MSIESILPAPRMKVSYCTSGFFKAKSTKIICLMCGAFLHGFEVFEVLHGKLHQI